VYATRILILVPHPDDEVVGCCAAIGRARLQGSRIFALYLTTGVPPREALWSWSRAGYDARVATRWREADSVRAFLTIETVGRADVASRTLRLHLAEAEARVARALRETQAEMLWCAAFEGAHQDHDAANAVASRFAGKLPVWEFAEYNNAGGRTQSQQFPSATGGETVLDLSPDEVAAKTRALSLYESERANLRHIAVARESFRPLPTHDYGKAPHGGTPFYARYRWVPFHPRVDRTAPADVYRTLVSYVAGSPSAAVNSART
jgi:LmbE family N-acetylglucosaminyl deacetylase